MKSYCTLMRLAAINLLASLRGSMSNRKTGRINVGYVVLTVIGVVGLLALACLLVFVEIVAFRALAKLGQPLLLPALALLLCTLLSLVTGAFHTLTRLYFSKDSAWLASLPLTSRTVMAARLTEVYLGELLLNILILAPALVMLCIHQGDGAGSWLAAAAVILLSPALPMAINTLLASLLARVTGLARHKEVLVTAGSMLLLAAVLALEFNFLPSIPDDAGMMYFVQLLLSSSGLVNMVTSAVPPIRWAVHGLAGDWTALGLYLLICVGSITAVVALMGGRYLTVCIGQSEQSARRKVRHLEPRAWRSRSQLKALYLREWAEVLRTPAYVVNGLESIIFVPLLAAFMCLGMASAVSLPEVLEQIQMFLGLIPGVELMLLCAGVMVIACFINPVISTGVSREGKHHDLYRMMPIDPATQIRAKLLVGMTINQLGALTTGILLVFVLGRYSLWLIPAFLLVGALNYAACAISLTIDVLNPRYDWPNETQVIKQSMSVMWGMVAFLFLLALPVGAWILVRFGAHASLPLRVLAVVGVVAAEAGFGFCLHERVCIPRYATSEG